MSTETTTNVFEEVCKNLKKATQANLKMQQDAMHQWATMWPGLPTPQSIWIDKVRDFQRQWSNTVSDLARKHRDTLNRQHQAALESLDEALRLTESTNPEDFRKRAEHLCRTTLDCMKEVSETNMEAFQQAMTKWGELLTKTGS